MTEIAPHLSKFCSQDDCGKPADWQIALIFFRPDYTPDDDFDYMTLMEKPVPAIKAFPGALCKEHREHFQGLLDANVPQIGNVIDHHYMDLAAGFVMQGLIPPSRETARIMIVPNTVIVTVDRAPAEEKLMGDSASLGKAIAFRAHLEECEECRRKSDAMDEIFDDHNHDHHHDNDQEAEDGSLFPGGGREGSD